MRRGGGGIALVALLLLLAGVPAAAAATPANPTLAGSASNAVDLSGVTSAATAGNYAYVTAPHAGRLVAVDVSTPSSPSVTGQTAQASSLLNAATVNVAGGYAYVVSKNRNLSSTNNDDGTGNSLTVVDIGTNPGQPAIVGSVHDSTNLFGGYGVAVSGNYAFVAAQGCLSGQPCPKPSVGNSFAVVDVSTKSSPKIVATLRNNSLPAPWTGSGALAHACAVAVSGNYAYVTSPYSNRLTIIDISNPLQPKITASLHDATALAFDVDVAVNGNYAYVADQATNLGRIAVVDISNPASPTVVGTLTNKAALNGAYRVRLNGNFLYVSGSNVSTIAAVDVSDPAHPRLAGSFVSTSALNNTTGVAVTTGGRYIIGTSPRQANETKVLYPPFPLQGGPTNTGTVSVIDFAPQPISVTINPATEPANPTTVTSANFGFTTSDSVAIVRCSLDGAPLGPCASQSSAAYGSLAAGTHSFVVQAADVAGNTASDSYSWLVSSGGGGGAPAPTTPVLDSFNRANGAIGPNWSLIRPNYGFSTMKIVSNAAADSSTSYAFNYWNPGTYGPDSETYMTLAGYGGDTVRLGARVSGGGTAGYSGYFLSVSGTGAWSILRIDNGTPTTLQSGPTDPLASGDKLCLRIVGNQISALHYTAAGGWTTVVSYDTSSDTTRYTGAGNLATEFKTSTIDDFGGGTI